MASSDSDAEKAAMSSPESAETADDNARKPSPMRLDSGSGISDKQSAPKKLNGDVATAEMNFVQEFVFVALVCMAQFMTQVGVGQTLAILHVIGKDLNITDPSELSWLMAAYSLTVGTFILPSGRWGDLFGYKKLYIIGLLWYAFWTMVAGLSIYSGKVLFNFARALQGIGPAICLPNALAILGSRYKTGMKKTMIFSAFGATAPLGSVAGAASGSLFALVSWPWAFYSCALVLIAIAVLTYFFVPPALHKGYANDVRTCVWRLDPIGTFTGVLGIILISFAWNQGPLAGWEEPYVYVILILGFIFVGVFLWVEGKVAEHPLLPLEHLNLATNVMLVCMFCGWACFGIFLFYTWQFFELLRHASPLLATAWYSTNGVSGAAAAILTGLFLGKVGPARAMVAALLAFTIGQILLMTAPVGQSYWYQSFWCLVIIPFGMDISFPSATVIISDQFPTEFQGIGASLVNTVVNYSISLGLGFAGTVEVHVNNGGKTEEDLLKGYRGACYMGLGFASLGLIISTLFWLYSERKAKHEAAKEPSEKAGSESQ